MKLVIMYTRPTVETPWFNNQPGDRLAEYGKKLRKVAKIKRVFSVDELSLWEFVYVADVPAWEAVRAEYNEDRMIETQRKRLSGVTSEIITLDEGVGDEFFDYINLPDEELEAGVKEVGVDIDISKFFW